MGRTLTALRMSSRSACGCFLSQTQSALRHVWPALCPCRLVATRLIFYPTGWFEIKLRWRNELPLDKTNLFLTIFFFIIICVKSLYPPKLSLLCLIVCVCCGCLWMLRTCTCLSVVQPNWIVLPSHVI